MKKIDEIRAEMNSPEGKAKRDGFFKQVERIFEPASIMKKNMLAKGLTFAKAKCPFCGGHWHARIAGPKKHFHMKCDGDCKSVMME
jgi:hypothetical protein